jgi:hypothetical protein
MQIKYKHLIVSILLSLWMAVGWGQTPQVTNVYSKSKTDTIAVIDTLDYDQSDRLISWLNKNITLTENQRKLITAKGKSVKKNFKQQGVKSEEINKQLQAEYKIVIDSILTSAQQDQLTTQFNASHANLKSKSNILKH